MLTPPSGYYTATLVSTKVIIDQCEDGVIKPGHIEFIIDDTLSLQNGMSVIIPLKQAASHATREAEKEVIKKALIITKGNKSRAARLLEVDYKTLLTKIKDYNISF